MALVGRAHHSKNPEGGEAIVGADQATTALGQIRENLKKAWKLSQWSALAMAGQEGSYFKNKSGGYGQYYRGVLSDLGIIWTTDDDIGVKLGSPNGLGVAELCDKQPGRLEFWKAVVDDKVSLDLIEELGD